jgi:predicted dinucleotide-binding enzyme
MGETPLLSVASELRIEDGAALPTDDRLSLAERAQELLRGPVVAGLHSLAALSLRSGRAEGDALVCGDDDDAKMVALDLATKLVTGRALDAGPLASARALEGLTAVIVNLNRTYRGHAGLQITGL